MTSSASPTPPVAPLSPLSPEAFLDAIVAAAIKAGAVSSPRKEGRTDFRIGVMADAPKRLCFVDPDSDEPPAARAEDRPRPGAPTFPLSFDFDSYQEVANFLDELELITLMNVTEMRAKSVTAFVVWAGTLEMSPPISGENGATSVSPRFDHIVTGLGNGGLSELAIRKKVRALAWSYGGRYVGMGALVHQSRFYALVYFPDHNFHCLFQFETAQKMREFEDSLSRPWAWKLLPWPHRVRVSYCTEMFHGDGQQVRGRWQDNSPPDAHPGVQFS